MKILDESIKALEEWEDKIVIRKFGICDELNWNVILVSFDPSSLDPVFVIVDAFSKTPQEFPDNRDS